MCSKQAEYLKWRARIWHCLLVLCLLASLGFTANVCAQTQQPVPALTAPIIDQTNTLSEAEKQALGAKLSAYEKTKGSQIVLLMVKTTQPEDIASYAYRVASTWKIGRRHVGDGVLVVVAKDDRRTRIEVARDLEGAIPDLMAAHILDTVMKPRFRAGDYAGGLSSAVDMITARLDGEELPAAVTAQNQRKQGVDWTVLLFAVVFVSLFAGAILKAIMGRWLGSLVTGVIAGGLVFLLSGLVLVAVVAAISGLFIALRTTAQGAMARSGGGPIIINGGGWGGRSDDFGGFGGGGFGGGGWGSGGGGDFGGGGASGDW